MAREPVDDLLADLDAALQASPSPDAIARVREQVRQDAIESRSGSRWWLVAAAAVAIAVAGAAMMMTLRRDQPSLRAPVAAVKIDTPTAVPPVTAAPSVSVVKRAPSIARAVVTSRTLPEVLVSPDEGDAIRRLLRAIRDGRATAPPVAEAIEDADGRLVEAKPIDIPLIKIEPLPGIPALAVGGKEK